jgi:SAM-dependent methyltransferase
MNQAEYWNADAGRIWADEADRLDRMLDPLGAAGIAALAPAAGVRALDIGCGAGASSRALAALGCAVTGVDVSAPLLDVARARAGGPDYLLADAGSDPLPGPFDVAFSRFGVMFFEDPTFAFTHIRAAMGANGRLCFICWASFADNDWARAPMQAIAPLLPTMPEPPPPDAPGPFAFADIDRPLRALKAAGWRDVAAANWRGILSAGETADEAVAMMMKIGPAGRALRENPSIAAAGRVELLHTFNRYSGRTGIQMPASTWIVTATA